MHQNPQSEKKKSRSKKKNKKKTKHASDIKHQTQQHQRPPAHNALTVALGGGTQKPKKKGSLLDQMRQKLQGGQFRWLNEQLYTTEGSHALQLMGKQPELYEQYHQGKEPFFPSIT